MGGRPHSGGRGTGAHLLIGADRPRAVGFNARRGGPCSLLNAVGLPALATTNMGRPRQTAPLMAT